MSNKKTAKRALLISAGIMTTLLVVSILITLFVSNDRLSNLSSDAFGAFLAASMSLWAVFFGLKFGKVI